MSLSTLKFGILWPHNTRKYPSWLTYVKEGFKYQDFMFWDVGWRIRKDRFLGSSELNRDITGYIWNSSVGMITHKALIQSIITEYQPNRERAREMDENLKDLEKKGICKLKYDKRDAPLYKYLRCGKKGGYWTRLEITELKNLKDVTELGNRWLTLKDVYLWDMRRITQVPTGICIKLPIISSSKKLGKHA